MRKNYLLITTALEQTWFKQQNFSRIFLTEACRLYSRKEEWQYLDCEIAPYHWNDRKKLKSDHDYLKILYENILISVSENLNRLNKTNESKEYWRIIIGPWLITYISIMFDRWEMIGRVFADGKKITTADLPQKHERIVAKDFDDFVRIMQSDEWNFQVYHRIINHRFKHQVTFQQIRQPTFKSQRTCDTTDYKNHVKYKTLVVADKLFKLISRNPKVFIYKGYFSPISLVKLNLSLRQVPRMYLEDFTLSLSAKYDFKYRSATSFDLRDNDFEDFFLHSLFLDMPIAYLEAYQEIKNFVDRIPMQPEKIMTANAYWGEDIFKYWLALQKKNNRKIIISHHGGSIPPLFDTFLHEEDIADRVATWFKPYHSRHIQLPPNKLCGITIPNQKGVSCSLIGFESPRFGYRATAGPIANRVIDCFNQSITFCEALKPEIKAVLKIRPYPDMGWQTKLRFSDKLGVLKIDSGSYKDFINNAKLLICTYPQTTFSEAMISGKPVILLYIPEFNEPVEVALELIDTLVNAKIIFSDPIKAAEHINLKWDHLEEWWETDEVINARKKFNDIALNIDKAWVKKWKSFLKNT